MTKQSAPLFADEHKALATQANTESESEFALVIF